MKLLFFTLFFGFGFGAYIRRDRPNEGAEISDTLLDTVSLIQKYKYPVEEHEVVTEDGYILTIHRIPYGRLCPQEKIKGPVILQHGVLAASNTWVFPGTRIGLGYILADSCYDVWMPNSRGNSLSLRHTKYTVRDPEYWDFSWHEMGVYDHPAVFDHVLNVTGAEDITYIGHSQGTSNFLVFNILRPEYNDKIRAAFLMAPIAYLKHCKSLLLQAVSRFSTPLTVTTQSLGIYDLIQQKDLLSNITDVFCTSLRPINPLICQNFVFLLEGFDKEQANMTFYTLYYKNELFGTSIKQAVHYAQLITSGKFQQYDYGSDNFKVYGQFEVPQYDLSKAKAPIHLFIAANDWLSDLKDVFRLTKELPNLRSQYLIPFEKFNHLDHLFAKDVIELEYDRLLQEIDSYYIDEQD